MLKKTITYRDYDDVERTEDFYFHLTQAELTQLAFSVDGGLEEYLKVITKSQNNSEILSMFQKIIAMAIGVRSEDGRRFIKTDEIRDDFLQTNAYQELFMELMMNPSYAVEFIRGALPSDLAEKAIDIQNQPREYTHRELLNMDEIEFRRVVGDDPKDMSRDHLLIAMERKNRQPA